MQLMTQLQALQIRLIACPSGVAAVFIQLSLSADDNLLDGAWVGPVACSTDRQPVRAGPDRGYGPGAGGNHRACVDLRAGGQRKRARRDDRAGALVETIGPERTTLPSTAARYGSCLFVLPPVPLSPLVDLAYAWRQQTLTACQARRA